MVKVVKGPDKWMWQFTCRGCEATCEATIEDVEWAMFGAAHYAGDSGDKHYYVPCPVCGTDAIIPDGKVTPLVEQGAKEYRAAGDAYQSQSERRWGR